MQFFTRFSLGLTLLLATSLLSANTESSLSASINFEDLSVAPFSAQLNRYISDGEVDYQKFRDNVDFDLFVTQIKTLDLESLRSPEQKLAFYINAYNALAIKGILDGRSPASFTGKVGFFYLSNYQVAGEKINLYDLEHQRIRTLDEPRIHFALVCAAISCPKLRSEAYLPETLTQQLDENARDFINDTSKNLFDKKRKTAKLSKIFKWFKEDFLATGATLQEYLANYVNDPEVAKDLSENNYRIKYMSYNWKLNGSL